MIEPYFTIGGVGLIRGDIKGFGLIMASCANEATEILKENPFPNDLPFKNINHIIRYGAESLSNVEMRINKKHLELETATQISLKETKQFEKNEEALRKICIGEINRVFSAISKKYKHQLPEIA